MKKIKATATLLLLLLGSVTATAAHAGPWHGGGWHGGWHGPYIGVGVGVGLGIGLATWPLYSPYYYPYGYYPYPAYAPVVVTQPAPATYVQQGNAAPAQPPANDWYYCHNPAGYYPYVKACPQGWQRVPAQPQQ